MHEIFRCQKIFWKTEGFHYEVFRHCETKKFRRKYVIPLPPHPVIHKFFTYQNFFENQNGSPTKFFGTVKLKFFDGKSLYLPTMHKKFGNLKFQETQKGSSTMFLGTNRLKIFGGKSCYPLFMIKSFSKPRDSQTQKGSSTMFFGTVRHQIFDGKS